MGQIRICPNIFFVTLRFLFILVLLLNISLHRRPLSIPANGKLEVTNHDNIEGFDITLETNKYQSRLAYQLCGRAWGENLPKIC